MGLHSKTLSTASSLGKILYSSWYKLLKENHKIWCTGRSSVVSLQGIFPDDFALGAGESRNQRYIVSLNFDKLAAFTADFATLQDAQPDLENLYQSDFLKLLLWRRQCSKYQNLPPGPRALPILGSLHLLGTHPHRSLAELALQYGPVMSVWFGQRLCIVASSPEAAKEFLKVQDANFSSRPTTHAAEIILPADMVLHDITSPIRHLQKILVTELMSTKQLESSQYIRREEMAYQLHKIANENGPCRMNAHVEYMTTNVLSRMIFNKRFLRVEEEDDGIKMVQEFIEIVKREAMYLSAIFIGDFFNFPKWFDPQGLNKQFWKLRASMDKFYEKMMDEYKEDQRKKPSKEGKKTLLDIFLEQLDFPENEDLLSAGVETTSLTIEWAMAEVLHNPTILSKAISELNRVVGLNRTVQESDLPHLKYLHAIVKETLRLHPLVPLFIPHQSKASTKAFGSYILAQTRLFVNLWAIGRNNNNWEKPLEFVPERFLEGGENGAMEFLEQHFELLPFGSGRRQCPGMGLASVSVHLQVASLLHAFEWEVKELKLEEARPGLTVAMQQLLVATAKTRLPLHLYEG